MHATPDNELSCDAKAGSGTGRSNHDFPFHVSAIARSIHAGLSLPSQPSPSASPPTATHDVFDVHETADRTLEYSPLGRCATSVVQAPLPPQRSASVVGPPGAPGPLPTAAHQSLATHDTDDSEVNVVAPNETAGTNASTMTTAAAERNALTPREPGPHKCGPMLPANDRPLKATSGTHCSYGSAQGSPLR